MLIYRTRWTHAERRAAFVREFDNFNEAVDFMIKVAKENNFLRNATIHKFENKYAENGECVFALRDLA